MGRRRYDEEFKIAAVRQVTVEGHSVPDVAKRLGITTKSLYDWKKLYGEDPGQISEIQAAKALPRHRSHSATPSPLRNENAN